MKPEKQDLIDDLLGEDSNRDAVLLAGARVLRRRRHWRAARQSGVVLVLIAVVAVLALKKEAVAPLRVARIAPDAAPVTQVRALTDDELLSLFPDTPVALAPLSDGKSRLFFLRPGDEQKYITRL